MTTTPTPKPGPRPGPRPGVTPAVRTQTAARPTVHSDPTRWGRIDDDGSVYVITASGERLIGSWQAGTREEGLAHYHTRFEDLVTEVELLENRLKAHPDDAAAIRGNAETLRATLPTAAAIGDLDSLDTRLAGVIRDSESADEKVKADRAQRRVEATARKEALVEEAEQIGESSEDWKSAGDRLREIFEEWKTIRGVDRKTDDVLWKRYSRARDAFNRRTSPNLIGAAPLPENSKRTLSPAPKSSKTRATGTPPLVPSAIL